MSLRGPNQLLAEEGDPGDTARSVTDASPNKFTDESIHIRRSMSSAIINRRRLLPFDLLIFGVVHALTPFALCVSCIGDRDRVEFGAVAYGSTDP